MVKVNVKGTFNVKSAEKTPTSTMFLPDIDQVIALTNAPAMFFFKQGPLSESLDTSFEALKDSLSKALVPFYPLAGRLQWTARNRLEINCEPKGVVLIKATSDSTMEDQELKGNNFCPGDDMKPLMPPLLDLPIEEMPLLLVQFTSFSCGVSLGVALSHVLADGISAFHFISVWSSICRGEQPKRLPFLDRTLLSQGEMCMKQTIGISGSVASGVDDCDQPVMTIYSSPPTLIGQENDSAERMKETATAVFKLSKDQIKMLVNKASDKNTPSCFTRYEALCVHLWRCLCKARKLHRDQKTEFGVRVNIRERIKPSLPEGYFGNAILPAKASSMSGKLLAEPLSYASGKIRDEIRSVTDDYVRSAIAYLRKEEDLSKFRYSHVPGTVGGIFYGNPNCVVVSWTSLPLSDIDFGFGEIIHMGPAGIGQDAGRLFFVGRRMAL